ncbi:hypothetical protein HRbin03_00119 [archaeon HR03]|nr:hypothetical protein HRbin03_00119 [archaeon HR03]
MWGVDENCFAFLHNCFDIYVGELEPFVESAEMGVDGCEGFASVFAGCYIGYFNVWMDGENSQKLSACVSRAAYDTYTDNHSSQSLNPFFIKHIIHSIAFTADVG